MPAVYTCPKCNHASVVDATGSSGPVACSQCGTMIDPGSNERTIDTVKLGAKAHHEPTAADKDSRVNAERKAQATPPSIPGYEILYELGRGGMGVVYKARDIKLQRLVAIKMIVSGAYSSPDQIARFETEAQAVAQLQHPNIVQIFEVGEVDGRPYCAFEFVDGGNLDCKRYREPERTRAAAELIAALARAMDLAHRRGIVHRDLKPDNVLLTSDGIPKITDFGLAKRMEAQTGQTQTGWILGTPGYMAPEQAEGKSKVVGPPADIWALGGLLYYLLTEQTPFQGTTVLETLEHIRTRDPIPPSRFRPSMSRQLETICLKCLEKEPGKRYASAGDLAEDLRRFLGDEPILGRSTSRLSRTLRNLKQRPATVALVGLLLGVVGLLAASLVWLSRSESARQVSSDSNRPYEIESPKGFPTLSIPPDNPLTAAKVELGKELFFDKRLSIDNTVSCATCHEPSKGWSNGKAVAQGVGGKSGSRSVPSLVNVPFQNFLLWDGGAGSLEEQALIPIQHVAEMAMPSVSEVESRLNAIEGYRKQFMEVFGKPATMENVCKALASFQRTLLSGNAPYDRFKAGDTGALSEEAVRGMKLFFHKAHCSACHSGPNFTDSNFHNTGVGMKSKSPDVGREKISGLLGDRGSFKTPSLREIARTPPYMHDGSLRTLEEVIDHYDRGGVPNPQLDEEIYPLKLTPQEKRDLARFLREGLTSAAFPFTTPPKLPD